MGAKTSEDEIPSRNGGGPLSAANALGGEPRGAHLSRDGDGSVGDKGGDDDDDDDEDNASAMPLSASADKKKRKRKPKKKKKKKAPTEQTSPPRVLLSDLFPAGDYPTGQFMAYNDSGPEDMNTARTTAAELRHASRGHLEDPSLLSDYRQAAEVHRQVRNWVQETVKPGQTLHDIAEGIEDSVRALLGHQGLEKGDSLKAGMGFPTGLCLNNQMAHYTPNPGQKPVVLQHQDVMKVDYGVHVNGWIVDSAFTMSFDPTYDNLLAAVKDATNSGIKELGIDVRICDISAAIQDTMESYEVEIGGKMYPVKPIRNLCAHNIARYHIHAGKSIPFIRNSDETKIEEGEMIAIETFGSTGSGKIFDDVGIYGYGLEDTAPTQPNLPFVSAKRLHKTIREQFGSIVFCRRYLERLGVERYLAGLNCLVSNGIIESYVPLADIKGSYSAQFEHTILMHEYSKEIISRGTDY